MLKTITEKYTDYIGGSALGWDVYFDLGDDNMDYGGYVSASNFNGHDNLSDAVEEIANAVSNRVRAGAIALDKHMPGWESKINVDALDMNNFLNCIIGQLFGGSKGFTPRADFNDVVKSLGAEDESGGEFGFTTLGGEFGFTVLGVEFGFNAKGSEFGALKVLWTEQIEWRLSKNSD